MVYLRHSFSYILNPLFLKCSAGYRAHIVSRLVPEGIPALIFYSIGKFSLWNKKDLRALRILRSYRRSLFVQQCINTGIHEFTVFIDAVFFDSFQLEAAVFQHLSGACIAGEGLCIDAHNRKCLKCFTADPAYRTAHNLS